MSALICTATVAATEPRSCLLEDQFAALGQLCVVRDEDWDAVVEHIKELDVDDTLVIVDTDQGPFLTVSIPSKLQSH